MDTLSRFTDELLPNVNVAIDTMAVFIDLRKAFKALSVVSSIWIIIIGG